MLFLIISRNRISNEIEQQYNNQFHPIFPSLVTAHHQVKQQDRRVVILGSGWGGFKLMRELKKAKYHNVTMISPRNHFVFTPLLASTSVGTLEFRCITEPVRSDDSKKLSFYQAQCNDIDFENQRVHCTSWIGEKNGESFQLEYDDLIIAVGSYSNTFNIPGVKEHAYFLKDINDARRIRKRIIECFEEASRPGLDEKTKNDLLHFVVVGGGPTGIEFSAELYDFISKDAIRTYPRDLVSRVRMTLYDVAPQILGSFDSQLSDYAHKKFKRKGIHIKTKRFVDQVQPDHLVIRDEGRVPYGLLVWATGLMPSPLIETLAERITLDAQNQRMVTNGNLQLLQKDSSTLQNVYALGDCATIDNYDLPATAQVATQKASYLAKVLNNDQGNINKTPPQSFMFKNRGKMAYIGSSEALVDMSSVHELAKQSGHLAWYLWRSAYLGMTFSVRNKMLIPYHWFLTWCFGRDISRF
ncbi:FAD/NAD(P)-binding domain-containing protein [Phascolomyces articulosus]|uniref:FAD/NAD(P)-binding domain-containing protein n=1 Tax=Phascolomyces articulosus TaxID=60185 RepID=A0AAD5PB71_9FUNG|nr:FAD/NAD(P)-binding domain-containing protein [Phascolomyces articulosus]